MYLLNPAYLKGFNGVLVIFPHLLSKDVKVRFEKAIVKVEVQNADQGKKARLILVVDLTRGKIQKSLDSGLMSFSDKKIH